ncbi:TPA: 50S ribosomal protein L15 [Trebouxia sp. C0005]|nr:MAG: 50S ribosomal chloroplastic-like [Trebouxia sp. A1-2]
MALHAPCAHLTSGLQVNRSSSSVFATGRQLRPATRFSLKRKAPHATVAGTATGATKEFADRFRLNNLSPQKGARRQEKRKGRGYGSGQGGTCGFGMRGQKARSGSGVRHGFEGGQTPLFRRLPKLKGIAGGMSAGLPKYITVNLSTLSKKFSDGEEVSVESLTQKRMLNLSGREAKLPLKVLGDGDLAFKLTIKAAKFSTSAKEKIQAAGGEAVEIPQKAKWTRALHKRKVAAAAAAAPKKAPAPKPITKKAVKQ